MLLRMDKIKKKEKKRIKSALRLVVQQCSQGLLASVFWVRASACTFVIPAVFYLSTRLAGCSVSLGISCDAYKLVRTPRITKKKYG